MADPVLETEENVTLLGGGAVSRATFLEVLEHAPKLAAADGAAERALDEGVIPDAVIGDFDSLSAAGQARLRPDSLFHVPEQDSTDFEKCLARIRAPMVFGVGFTGERIDHELSVYHVLARYPDRNCVIVGERDVVVHAPPELALGIAPGTRVSLFPMAEVTGRSEGLRWPISGIGFAPWRRIGTSNEASAAEIRLRFDGPGMLLILPRSELWTLAAALARHG
ncbi:thiamine diphosphokinase [Celeribacter indicus]|uniref:Thiamine diphosphokinase n=1 Tax=Celeribacter indicus TaxID=1208324 RepID=A0A0B5DXR2_9RHOB|nr:thiamine diphosphokinase [Celeribacter indicus]AJE48223.1 thiamine pyrophosphokinase [Celeribacter indicus]SDW69931.1 thiamine pyrophosphokinase [Celeribacter indicus]